MRCRPAILALVAASLAGAQPAPPMPAWRWWVNPTIVAEIGLGAEQSAALDRAQTESRAQRAAVGRRLRERRVRLGELLSGPSVDRAELARVLGDISRLQRDQLRSVVHLRLRARRILTAEQLARLLALHPALMERPWEGPRRGGPARLRPSGSRGQANEPEGFQPDDLP
jgi:Spy/CpxP family protein refolding chaperone